MTQEAMDRRREPLSPRQALAAHLGGVLWGGAVDRGSGHHPRAAGEGLAGDVAAPRLCIPAPIAKQDGVWGGDER
jgi:hypothetical protein